MNVLAINSSARVGKGSKTEIMLEPLVQGMRDAGALVEVVNLVDRNIKTCIGCFTCMTKTPGVCILKDDMTRELFPKWLEADIVVYATPLFYHTVNATMKTFLERTFPVALPFLEFHEEDGRWHHPLRHKAPKSVFLSVCGFPASSAFDALRHYVNYLFGAGSQNVLAEIYRDGAEGMLYEKKLLDEITSATRDAGRQLIEEGAIRPETMETIEQPVVSDFALSTEIANCAWRTCIADGITLQEFQDQGMSPRPDTLDSYLAIMRMGFNPKGAVGKKAVLQFNFTGSVEDTCQLVIDDGSIKAIPGAPEKPDLTIMTPFDLWADIVAGRADGQQMFMERKYNVEGDPELLIQFGQFFNRPE
jgi:multimeric flavodoxin WrbA/putative sterol carrier protein